MNKRITICIVCVIMLLALFGFWSRERYVDIFESLDAAELDRISMYPGGSENTFTDAENIDKIVNVLRSMRLHKSYPCSRDGDLAIELYGKNGDMERIGLFSDHIVTDSGYYACDRNYCDILIRLCEARERSMIEHLGEYLNQELHEEKVKEISIGTGTGGKEIHALGRTENPFH